MDVPTSLAGYAMPGHGIAPAERLLGLPGFWPAYLGAVRGEPVPEPELFGADAADMDAAAEALWDATSVWPAYRIPLPEGRVLWIVHRNFPDDAGTDYLLTDQALSRERQLASIDGHFSGPAFSWPDLLTLADEVPADGEGVRDPDLRLLLLLPAYGDADTPVEEALVRISTALVGVGVAPDAAPGLAERFLDHPLWESPYWSAPGSSPLSGGGGDSSLDRGSGGLPRIIPAPLTPSTGTP
ncbi:hypothetical protein [Streptomyces sp. SID13726]|uniref:hypothetical protein n=1 Tax=Streptomyces sp. SID13726 TaxID=2706058 RepID=UPI0013BB2A1E|nr:hypothetical protein [Streptomyces sp. SID13726]NEB02226.1 hypothetical protein [Streptomyces sp. SID13726]